MNTTLRRYGAALLATAALAGCVNTTSSGEVGVQRKQFILLSEQEVTTMSAQAYAQEVQKAKTGGALNTNAVLTRRVRTISERLIRQTPVFRPDARNWKWEVNVANSSELNAYCMAGGKIMVYSGLVERLSLSDDELATVIGHEMAHALREHSRESMSQAYAQQAGLSIVGQLAGLSQASMELASLATDVTLTKPHSRTMESEADTIGLELMARAGYNPQASLSLWQKMLKAGGGGNGPAFLSTHPAGEDRIASLQRLIPKVMPLYLAAPKK
ncbi:M48 family metallopeptidase [Vogesella sp. LIG4]|uniref:M48 family metallopeptidase n=1 Tax=Vogesella sp. LIG4 TaxID=1192162 RepID=UPI00081FA848|nr:M48 family metallopeptidase [Vogesella sp. LIG4]SCK12826.1 Peptidase family M48 [Vogesella sp. LIG4]